MEDKANMSIKSTREVSRPEALIVLELPNLNNNTLASILDLIADSGEAKSVISYFDNFNVRSGA
jgi:hypothetical protein